MYNGLSILVLLAWEPATCFAEAFIAALNSRVLS